MLWSNATVVSRSPTLLLPSEPSWRLYVTDEQWMRVEASIQVTSGTDDGVSPLPHALMRLNRCVSEDRWRAHCCRRRVLVRALREGCPQFNKVCVRVLLVVRVAWAGHSSDERLEHVLRSCESHGRRPDTKPVRATAGLSACGCFSVRRAHCPVLDWLRVIGGSLSQLASWPLPTGPLYKVGQAFVMALSVNATSLSVAVSPAYR